MGGIAECEITVVLRVGRGKETGRETIKGMEGGWTGDMMDRRKEIEKMKAITK